MTDNIYGPPHTHKNSISLIFDLSYKENAKFMIDAFENSFGHFWKN